MEHWEALPQSFGQSGKEGISPPPLFLPESNQETETTWAFINSNFKTGNKLHGNGGTESQIQGGNPENNSQKELFCENTHRRRPLRLKLQGQRRR